MVTLTLTGEIGDTFCKVLFSFQVSVNGDGKLRVTALQKLVVNYSILSLHWLNSWTLAVIDISERLHLLDVHTHEELENLDVSNIGLVYESSHFKGIFTGGNVSKAMVCI